MKDESENKATGKRHFGSNTPGVARDAWQTPKWLFNHFAQMAGGFDIDAAANEHNALCEAFFSEADNALSFDWDAGKKYWLNPPYSNILPWVEHAVVQGERPGSVVYMLLPDEVSTLWFRTAMDNAAEAYIIAHDGVKGSAGRSGRVQFVNAITGKTGNGNNKGSWVFVFRRSSEPVKISLLDRAVCEPEAAEVLDGNRYWAWDYFANLVAMTLLARGLVTTKEGGIEFAGSLDMSFEDLYANYPRSRWHQQIIIDCDEYENDLERLKNDD